MPDEWDLNNLARQATDDQTVASLVGAGRAFAAFYRTLVDGGVPPRTARMMVVRQQTLICNLTLLAAQAKAVQGE